MRYRAAGGLRLSVVGLGTWQFGTRQWGYGGDYADREAFAIVHRALELGVTLVDTAEVYGYGRSERIVGRALADRRDSAVLATKLYPVLPVAPVVRWRAAASARRLGVERIDLYQLHGPNPVVPLSTTMAGMAELRRRGLVREVGVSNLSLAGWRAAEAALGAPVVSNQVRYSLAARHPERELLGWAREHDRVVIAYSPLAQGLLAGRYDQTGAPGRVRTRNPLFAPENLARAAGLLAAVRQVAAEHGATAGQVALAWLLRRPNVVVIPGARTVGQLEENVAAADLELTDADDDRLTAASDAFHPRTDKGLVRQELLRRWRPR